VDRVGDGRESSGGPTGEPMGRPTDELAGGPTHWPRDGLTDGSTATPTGGPTDGPVVVVNSVGPDAASANRLIVGELAGALGNPCTRTGNP
jgi:hypothetical protein